MKNRPGKFNKTITVTSNATSPISKLKIVGNVIPIPGIFRYEVGNLKIKTNNVTFRKLMSDKIKTIKREVLNDGNLPIVISFGKLPNYFELRAVPDTLLPGEKGNIIAVYDAKKNPKMGFNNDIVEIIADDGEQIKTGKLKVSATLIALKPKVEKKIPRK